MNLSNKLKILAGVYNVYEQFLKDYPTACQRRCADCCTCNLTMTTLEAYYLIENLILDNKAGMLTRLDNSPQKRYQPDLTFNRIAQLCAQGKNVPEGQSDPAWGKCPFLENLECTYYRCRPFGCRCMTSIRCCAETGFAEMDPLVMSVNHVFMQFIEHVDAQGYSGNFTDVLNSLANEKNRTLYEQNRLRKQHGRLISNVPIPMLMVPPKHRQQIAHLLSVLNGFLADDN